jgi:hypothetical protein
MNIFEDLIEELKEENLIERTVIEMSEAESDTKKPGKDIVKVETSNDWHINQDSEGEIAKENPGESSADGNARQKESVSEEDFYRRRAIEEVDFLQTVEHVFAGIEREQLKIVPNPYDGFKVKKVLHSFLQIPPDADSTERARLQFQLLQETENWHSSLALRDRKFLTAHLRRHCESSRPPLGSPALVALARFYRNSPYSEQVRSKFDLILTRLFTKETGNCREMLFTRDALARHIKELYAEWSSVPLYSIEEDEAQTVQTAWHFEEFIREVNTVENFDDLINKNFFNRLRLFKESTNEVFYAPLVAATGIEINVCVGNQYVELLNKEQEKVSADALEDKYGLAHDQAISEASGKTISLIELLGQKKPDAAPAEEKSVNAKNVIAENKKDKAVVPAKAVVPVKAAAPAKAGFGKWIIAMLVLAAILLGIYFIAA